METNEILKQVKNNRKYKTISDEIVLQEINNYLKSHPKEKINRLMIKEIRKNLHRLYSSYLRGKKSKRIKLLEQLKQNPDNIEIINKILSTSLSTKERLNDYPTIYKKIFEITGKPSTIIDLGCGLNPISFPYMDIKQVDYYAHDIDNEDIDFINNYFKIMNINGKAQILNVRDLEEISKLPSTDIVLMFKLIDLINTKNNKPGEELIKILIKKTKFIVASFATRTLGGKPMNLPRRKGFELMLERIGLRFETFSIKNEVFYVISKKEYL